MVESEDSPPRPASPLFDKMDALLARHRGPGGVKAEIPVLTDEAPFETHPSIPVLTEIVSESAPIFDSHDFFTASPLPPFPDPAVPVPTEALFLDLPLLDLEGLADNPAGLSDVATPEMPASQAAEPPALETSESELEEIEIEELFGVDVQEQELSLTEHALSHDEHLADTEDVSPAPRLTDAAIAEITASVAAQIAVDISSEVAQLTRQHFAGMMSTFYADSLHKLTEEISRDMEMCLAPRIAELVQDELRRQGLVE